MDKKFTRCGQEGNFTYRPLRRALHIIMKLSKETRFYYLDYLQKQVNKLVRGQEIPLGTIDQMLFMINELKKE